MTEEILINLQGAFGYQCVRIRQSQGLGVGSYGSVCRATLDELPCAAKLLHATFFGTHDPGAANFTARFEQECHFLSNLRHPCIVQYLGLVREPRTLRPILLMELMDESLTKFLERTTRPLPYHAQVNIIHDTALALAYLHSNHIIHRDLSSNNILLLAGSRAKVTDFGMSRIVGVTSHMTPLTQCPGTPAFMAPEALLANPVYSDKLDVFSTGVLTIQVMTRRFPTPRESKRVVNYPTSPTGVIEIPVPEKERRKDDLDRIASTHPLLSIAVMCIKDRERERPSAAELCQSLTALKEAPAYAESVLELPEDTVSLQQSGTSLEEKEQMDKDHQKQPIENEKQLEEAVLQLAEKEESIQTKDQEIRTKDQQLQEKEKEIAYLRKEVADLQQLLTEFQENQLEESEMTELPERTHSKEVKITELKLQWQTRRRAPVGMYRGTAIAHHNSVYCISSGSNTVYLYQVDNDVWQEHSQCPHRDPGLVIIKEILTAVGGEGRSGKTNKLVSWKDRRWEEVFPPMNIARWDPAVVSDDCHVIAVGGQDDERTVELFTINSTTWSTVSNLPKPLRCITATLSGNTIYAMDRDGHTYSISLLNFTSTDVSSPQPRWLLLPHNAPVQWSTLSVVNGEVVAVGGKKGYTTTTRDIYQLHNGKWEKIGRMNTARRWPMVAVLPGDRMIVVGGSFSPLSYSLTAVELAVLC